MLHLVGLIMLIKDVHCHYIPHTHSASEAVQGPRDAHTAAVGFNTPVSESDILDRLNTSNPVRDTTNPSDLNANIGRSLY